VVDAEAGSQPAAATLVAAADDEQPQVAAAAALQVGVGIESPSRSACSVNYNAHAVD
jgi:hypothetical protein